MQAEHAEKQRAYLRDCATCVERLQASAEHELRRRAAAVLRRHAELAHRLLQVCAVCDICTAILAAHHNMVQFNACSAALP